MLLPDILLKQLSATRCNLRGLCVLNKYDVNCFSIPSSEVAAMYGPQGSE